jgi:hypothetical protein
VEVHGWTVKTIRPEKYYFYVAVETEDTRERGGYYVLNDVFKTRRDANWEAKYYERTEQRTTLTLDKQGWRFCKGELNYDVLAEKVTEWGY